MVFMPLVVAFVLGSGLLQPSPAPVPPAAGQLRFVRGAVVATSPTSLTVQLRNKSITLSLDPQTRTMGAAGLDAATAVAMPPAAGALIEVHYIDRKPIPQAIFIVAALPATTQVSNRPGRSYRGVVSRAKSGSLALTVDTKRRGVTMDRKTKLFDADGRSLAIGGKAVSGQLVAGDPVLVTYDEQSDDVFSGDVYIPGSHQRALEIRRLGD